MFQKKQKQNKIKNQIKQKQKQSPIDFHTIHKIKFTINNVIIMKQGEPKNWFFTNEKGIIETKDEEWLKLNVIKEYFKNPKIRKQDLAEIENQSDTVYLNFSEKTPSLKIDLQDKFLFYFYQKVRDSVVIRPASQSVIEELLSKPQDYQEFLNYLTKIIGYYPINSYKGCSLYQVQYNGKKKRAERICFNNQEGEADFNYDKNNMEAFKPGLKDFTKCEGIYCNCDSQSNNTFYDENDEAFSLYVMKNKNKQYQSRYIQYKSIYLDIIERFKTKQIIQRLNPQVKITEQLLFKTRKFYSISQLANSKQFKHFRFDNFYKRVRVCQYCECMYNKIDNIRANYLQQPNLQQITTEQIQAEIEKLSNSQGFIRNNKYIQKKYIYIFELKQKQLVVLNQKKDNYLQIIKMQQKKNQKKKNQINKIKQKEQKQFALPKITQIILKDKQGFLTQKKGIVNKQEAEALGLKHYLGHTKNLPYSDCGLAISKSSLALNQLQDKIKEVETLKYKMENQKIKKVVEEIELIMCPYYGKGQVDTSRLEQFINVLKVKFKQKYIQQFIKKKKRKGNKYMVQIMKISNIQKIYKQQLIKMNF
ncbi:hypothetical protein IMG5_202020 [Ichthyophthirius multifiliis]|uniref:Uncharacterized protein n=1 Tax=Ichthyophthirius multifiliis TaxID=5932 RepID=G0R619_ICHMU|nr:hypothetical protein IMG5_202020 [Ichthyophthirius multifiliis]EGR27085.1 hypothetical protein IMG5_202020 [Ichthyophthirius multifiliis]|eukprot:XP_004023969.1 hypothetical protein IMG5_202020 [Ichthyophthirius multifiliis]